MTSKRTIILSLRGATLALTEGKLTAEDLKAALFIVDSCGDPVKPACDQAPFREHPEEWEMVRQAALQADRDGRLTLADEGEPCRGVYTTRRMEQIAQFLEQHWIFTSSALERASVATPLDLVTLIRHLNHTSCLDVCYCAASGPLVEHISPFSGCYCNLFAELEKFRAADRRRQATIRVPDLAFPGGTPDMHESFGHDLMPMGEVPGDPLSAPDKSSPQPEIEPPAGGDQPGEAKK